MQHNSHLKCTHGPCISTIEIIICHLTKHLKVLEMTYQVRRKYKIFISNIPATTFFISTKNITIQSIISKTTLCIQRDKQLDSRAHGASKFSSCFSNKGNMKEESKCFSEETWHIFPENPLKRPFPHSCEQRHWLKLWSTKYSDL